VATPRAFLVRNDSGWLCSNPTGYFNCRLEMILICSGFSVTAIFSYSEWLFALWIWYMFLGIIQAMAGWGITFLGQLYYHLGFTVCIFLWQWVTNLSHSIMFHFWFYSCLSIICLTHAQQTVWFISPPKNEWRILFLLWWSYSMMNGLHPAALLPFLYALLNTNFYCDPHSGGYPLGNLLESVQ
jgi:hypothetical protein